MYIPTQLKVRIESEEYFFDESIKKHSTRVSETPLAYVTYIDEKGKLRKEVSWNGWGDKFLGDFTNELSDGFRVEGVVKRSSEWFGSGRNMYRVVHPHGFKFEITANNFYEIVLNCVLDHGDINDRCILAWDGASLALIPESADIYQENIKHTSAIESGPVKPSQLVVGKPYQNRAGEFIGHYVGKFPCVRDKYKYISRYDYRTPELRDVDYDVTVRFSMIHVFDDGRSLNEYVTPKAYEFEGECPEYKSKNSTYDELLKRKIYNVYLIPREMFGKTGNELMEWAIKHIKTNSYQGYKTRLTNVEKTYPKVVEAPDGI